MRAFTSLLALPLVAASLVSCGQVSEPPPPSFKFEVKAESDPGVPVSGVVLTRVNKEVGKTDATGKASMVFQGNEGDTFDIYVRCPEADYMSPTQPIVVRLSKLSDGKVLSASVRCSPLKRKVVVAVRADGGPNLPVVYYGNVVARTDSAGAAHFFVIAKPSEQLQFTLSTDEPGNELIQPKNPNLTVLVKDQDDVYIVDQPFQQQKVVHKVVTQQQTVVHHSGPKPL
jgi:hypothetical protein